MLRLRDVARGGDGLRKPPILLLLPHEPLLLLPEDAAVALASALVLDALSLTGAYRGIARRQITIRTVPTCYHVSWQQFWGCPLTVLEDCHWTTLNSLENP